MSPDNEDIRQKLRKDHEASLAELEALRGVSIGTHEQLRRLRRSWMIHALAEESVVYRALEGVQSAEAGTRADDRFAEHELVEEMFDRLSRIRPGSVEWHARLDEVRDLIEGHVENEHDEMFARLADKFDAEKLRDMGRNFELTRSKLTLLEEAKAA